MISCFESKAAASMKIHANLIALLTNLYMSSQTTRAFVGKSAQDVGCGFQLPQSHPVFLPLYRLTQRTRDGNNVVVAAHS